MLLLFLVLLLNPAVQAPVGKIKLFITTFAIPQAPAPRKIGINTTQMSTQWLTDPFNPFSFHYQTQCGEGNSTYPLREAGNIGYIELS